MKTSETLTDKMMETLVNEMMEQNPSRYAVEGGELDLINDIAEVTGYPSIGKEQHKMMVEIMDMDIEALANKVNGDGK